MTSISGPTLKTCSGMKVSTPYRASQFRTNLYAAAEIRVPDIVLLDMKMGAVSGAKVVEHLLAALAGDVHHHRDGLSVARRYARDF